MLGQLEDRVDVNLYQIELLYVGGDGAMRL